MRRLLALLLFVASPALGQGFPQDLTGRWAGTGLQEDGQRWQVTVDLGPESALVEYPDVPCSALWTYAPPGDGGLSGLERLTAGHDLCIDMLEVLAFADAKGTLLVFWYNKDGTQNSTATLIRQ